VVSLHRWGLVREFFDCRPTRFNRTEGLPFSGMFLVSTSCCKPSTLTDFDANGSLPGCRIASLGARESATPHVPHSRMQALLKIVCAILLRRWLRSFAAGGSYPLKPTRRRPAAHVFTTKRRHTDIHDTLRCGNRSPYTDRQRPSVLGRHTIRESEARSERHATTRSAIHSRPVAERVHGGKTTYQAVRDVPAEG
jgi:hypothetical protein